MLELKGTAPIQVGTKEITVDADGFFDLVHEFQSYRPGLPFAEVISFHFRDVCIKSLIDEDYYQYLKMEAFCKEYHCLPFEGSMMDQPNILIEIFSVIRGTRAEFEINRQKEMMKKVDKQKGQKV